MCWRAFVGRAVAVAALAAGPIGFGPIAAAAQEHGHTEPGEHAGEEHDHDHAHDSPAEHLGIYDEITIRERADDLIGIAVSASEGSAGAADLARRLPLRAGDIVETVPGMVATQHSGGGKANQYYLRGFNLDHGTDFSVSVAGMPVNMPSHGHGQGYADLNFLIPELVESVGYRKGTYFADSGDFSAAGSADIRLRHALPDTLVRLGAGSFGFGRAVVGHTLETASGELMFAAEGSNYDGPWTRGDDARRLNGLVSYHAGDGVNGWSLTAMGYDGSWLATDQIPRRAVESGLVGRFDLLDPGSGGDSRRFSVSTEIHRGRGYTLNHFRAYVVSYDFSLFSNFTYLLEDPELGDQFEQADDRIVYGLGYERHWHALWGDRHIETSGGLQLRFDDIENGLFNTRNRRRLATRRHDTIRQLTGGPWAQSSIRWSPKFQTTFGLRLETFDADVLANDPRNSGSESDSALLPKLSLTFGPWGRIEYYLNFGQGHHSNDARGVMARIDPATGLAVDPARALVRAQGAEFGLRTEPLEGLQTTISVFALDLESELVFVGDAGATEASRPSRRTGVEWTNFYQMNRRLSADLDLTWSRARFDDDDPAGERIPNSIGTTVAGGLAYEHPAGASGALRWRYFHDIPLIEDGSVVWAGSSVVNARFGYRFGAGLRVDLDLFNLFDENHDDVRYFYTSRLPGEPPGGFDDVHFHPLERRGVRLSTTWTRPR